jgi:hypothetical protein
VMSKKIEPFGQRTIEWHKQWAEIFKCNFFGLSLMS